eukprot:scaffold17_cov354-Pavlova_lutheri.AAC.60
MCFEPIARLKPGVLVPSTGYAWPRGKACNTRGKCCLSAPPSCTARPALSQGDGAAACWLDIARCLRLALVASRGSRSVFIAACRGREHVTTST